MLFIKWLSENKVIQFVKPAPIRNNSFLLENLAQLGVMLKQQPFNAFIQDTQVSQYRKNVH